MNLSLAVIKNIQFFSRRINQLECIIHIKVNHHLLTRITTESTVFCTVISCPSFIGWFTGVLSILVTIRNLIYTCTSRFWGTFSLLTTSVTYIIGQVTIWWQGTISWTSKYNILCLNDLYFCFCL